MIHQASCGKLNSVKILGVCEKSIQASFTYSHLFPMPTSIHILIIPLVKEDYYFILNKNNSTTHVAKKPGEELGVRYCLLLLLLSFLTVAIDKKRVPIFNKLWPTTDGLELNTNIYQTNQ